jgi:hypothetical protein
MTLDDSYLNSLSRLRNARVRSESRAAMIEQLLVQYEAKESCAGLRVSRSAFYRRKSGQESRRAREQREIVQKITKA